MKRSRSIRPGGASTTHRPGEFMLRLYDYAASGNCYKVRLLLAQLGTEYERVPVDLFAGETLTDEFAAMNPARETPVLEIEPGEYLPESGAILAYLASDTPFLPEDPLVRARVIAGLIFEQNWVAGTMGALRFRLQTGRLAPDDPRVERRRAPGAQALALLDHRLSASDFMAGESYTIADIAVYAYAHVAGEAGLDTSVHPAFEAWLRRVESTPGFMNDMAPYPPNAMRGAGQSTYG